MKAIDAEREFSKGNRNIVVRIHNDKAQHVASYLPCAIKENKDVEYWDLAKPDGTVLMCMVPNEVVDFMATYFGWSELADETEQ